MLPPFPQQFSKAMIINTDEFSKPGDHWLGLVLTKKKFYYFDSFALPVFNKNILEYPRNNYYKLIYSDLCIEHMLRFGDDFILTS